MATSNARNFLVEVGLKRELVPSSDEYPFSIPAIRGLDSITFDRPVTFFVGENGSGKSTLLEAIATGSGLNAEGGSRNFHFATREERSGLRECLRFTRSLRRAHDSYFLRAESYFNVATEIDALDCVAGPGVPIIRSYGGKSLHERSHGESFFALFMDRLGPEGFYLLDEPEAALSPNRQLSFLARLHQLVGVGSQFIIATHSPILMGYPDAAIWLLGDGPPRLTAYRDTEHYTVTKSFLTRTDQMLDILLDRTGESLQREGAGAATRAAFPWSA